MTKKRTWNPLDPCLVASPIERQRMAVFACCVPGKNAAPVWEKVKAFLAELAVDYPLWKGPFSQLCFVGGGPLELERRLRRHRLSPYTAVASRLRALGDQWNGGLDWRKLDGVKHFGPKTVRFIALYTDPKARVAALDVHVLRWLRDQGHRAPLSTPPPGALYDRLERAFLAEADRLGVAPWELDRRVWLAGRETRTQPSPV